MVDGRYSPPTLPRSRTMDVSNGVPVHPAKEKPPINVVGDVGGRIAIMVVSNGSFLIILCQLSFLLMMLYPLTAFFLLS